MSHSIDPKTLAEALKGCPFCLDLKTRKTLVGVVEVVGSNPNGDPDNDGAPRTNPADGHGEISCQSIKRVARDYVANLGVPLFIARGADLGKVVAAYTTGGKEVDVDQLRLDHWDLRVFGGVIPRSERKTRGAFQITEALSVDPVDLQDIGCTRVSGYERDAARPRRAEEPVDKIRGANMASYTVVRYGVYVFSGSYDPVDAEENGLTETDAFFLYAGLIGGWDGARSAHRVRVNLRRLYVFDHGSQRGIEPTYLTHERVQIVSGGHPKRWEDYTITVDEQHMPKGMTLSRWEDGSLLLS